MTDKNNAFRITFKQPANARYLNQVAEVSLNEVLFDSYPNIGPSPLLFL